MREDEAAKVLKRDPTVAVERRHGQECDAMLLGGRRGWQRSRRDKREKQKGINGQSTVTGTLGWSETWPV